MKKADVNGENELPLYTFLKSQKGFEGFGEHKLSALLSDMLSKADPDWDKNVPLNYGNGNSGLWDYQEETLRMWAKYVDGFSCIAAPRVPMKFWRRVQKTVSQDKPDFLWILMNIERRETLWDYL